VVLGVAGLGTFGFINPPTVFSRFATFGQRQPTLEHNKYRRLAVEQAKEHLRLAEQRAEHAVDEIIRDFARFFEDPKANCRAFAGEALSGWSKIYYFIDWVPLTQGGRHEAFIREASERHFFSVAKLQQEVERAIRQYLERVQGFENRMWVDLRVDTEGIGLAHALTIIDLKEVQTRYEEAFAHTKAATGSRAAADITSEVAASMSGMIVAQAGTQLLARSGIIAGVGAASAWSTLGIGVILSLIFDQILSAIYDALADPQGALAAAVEKKLDEIKDLIVDGSDELVGLRARLREIAQERARLRSTVVLAALEPQNEGSWRSWCAPCLVMVQRFWPESVGAK